MRSTLALVIPAERGGSSSPLVVTDARFRGSRTRRSGSGPNGSRGSEGDGRRGTAGRAQSGRLTGVPSASFLELRLPERRELRVAPLDEAGHALHEVGGP